jgi:hypothetical protein
VCMLIKLLIIEDLPISIIILLKNAKTTMLKWAQAVTLIVNILIQLLKDFTILISIKLIYANFIVKKEKLAQRENSVLSSISNLN